MRMTRGNWRKSLFTTLSKKNETIEEVQVTKGIATIRKECIILGGREKSR